MTRPLRIAQVAPPFERVPPQATAAPSGSCTVSSPSSTAAVTR